MTTEGDPGQTNEQTAELFAQELAARNSYQNAHVELEMVEDLRRQAHDLGQQITDLVGAPTHARQVLIDKRDQIASHLSSQAEIDDLTAAQIYSFKNAPLDKDPSDFANETLQALMKINERMVPGTPILKITESRRVLLGFATGPCAVSQHGGHFDDLTTLYIPVENAYRIYSQADTYSRKYRDNFETPDIWTRPTANLEIDDDQLRAATKPYEISDYSDDDDGADSDSLLIGEVDIRTFVAELIDKAKDEAGALDTDSEDLLFSVYAALILANANIDLPDSHAEFVTRWREETLTATREILTGIKSRVFYRSYPERYGDGLSTKQFRELGMKCSVLGITESDILLSIENSDSITSNELTMSKKDSADVAVEVARDKQRELKLIQVIVANYMFGAIDFAL
jgi:hypothetical protein